MSGIVDAVARLQDLTARIASTQTLTGGAFSELLRQAGAAVASDPASPTATRPGDVPGLLPGTRWSGTSTSGPPLPPGISNELVTWRGVTMNAEAMAMFQEAARILGRRIDVTSAFRTEEQQAALYRAKPGLAAPPGSSYHERGLAIDIDTGAYGGTDSPQFRRVVEVLESLGWSFFDPAGEPWHASYRVVG